MAADPIEPQEGKEPEEEAAPGTEPAAAEPPPSPLSRSSSDQPAEQPPTPATRKEPEPAATTEAAVKPGDKPAEPQEDPNTELDKLEPYGEDKIWIIGKPPEKGGGDDDWLKLHQRPLGYVPRMRFMALLARTMTKAIEGGSTIEDLISEAQGLRGRRLTTEDLQDVGSVLPVVLRLVADVPDFLVDAYILLLDVPQGDRRWFREVMEQSYIPEAEQWGLTDDQGIEIIEVALDQNFEPIREFFTGKLPRIAARVRAKEVARKSASAQ